jgi:HAE1 family hydrophobic/amphiphilic exporter-1
LVQPKDRNQQLQAIKQRLNQELSRLPQGAAFSFSPPAIPGVGTSGGFTFVLEDRGGNDIPYLAASVDKFLAAARKRPEIAGINTSFLPSVPQEFVEVDRDKALKQGVAISDVYTTLQAYMGGIFVNYFNRFGRQWQVYVEAEGDYRTAAPDTGQFYVRNNTGAMVPLSALTKFEPRFGPEYIMHYNEYPSAQINGSAAPGYSSDQAMAALEEVFAQTMPLEFGSHSRCSEFEPFPHAERVSTAAARWVAHIFRCALSSAAMTGIRARGVMLPSAGMPRCIGSDDTSYRKR